jgi:hypothetical protein
MCTFLAYVCAVVHVFLYIFAHYVPGQAAVSPRVFLRSFQQSWQG